MSERSLAEELSRLPEVERLTILQDLTEEQAAELQWDWRFWARPSQIPPSEALWTGRRTWLLLGGRGAGKTRTGAEFVRDEVTAKRATRIALIAETQKDLEEVMVFGDSGLVSVFPPHQKPIVTKKPIHIKFHTGAQAFGYNATEPDQLRGPNFDLAWCDEMAKWRYAQATWDMLQFALRLGKFPKQVVTTTPRPVPILKEILHDPTTIVTRDTTYANRINLAPVFLDKIRNKYEGTRLGRQEIGAEMLDDVPGALWTRKMLDDGRRDPGGMPTLRRVVVAVDPPAKDNSMAGLAKRLGRDATPDGDLGAAAGIIAAGIGADGRGYVLDDATLRASPMGWAARAVSVYDRHEADCIVGEVNNGGDMVETTIRSVRSSVPYKPVHASRGKWTRAEPIAALYEQGRVSHVGIFPELEDEMVVFGPNGMADGMSPDRVDALVWALTELFPAMTKVERKGARVTRQQGFPSDPLGSLRR